MGLLTRKGQALIQYFLVALVILVAGVAFVPVFQETNKALVENAARKNPTSPKGESPFTEPPPRDFIEPGPEAPPPANPDPPAGPPPARSNDLCADSTGNCCRDAAFLAAEELVCGVIPGPAGVDPLQSAGCWICDHTGNFWYWEVDGAACNNLWCPIPTGICDTRCSTESLPFPLYGNDGDGSYCFVCSHAGTNQGLWQRRGYDDESKAVERYDPGCVNFWTVPPGGCRNSDISYANCGCTTDPPPAYGSLVNDITKSESCWLCLGSDKWINTWVKDWGTDPDLRNNPDGYKYCRDMWLKDSCPAGYTDPYNTDFPYCGCPSEPPYNQRGPNGIDTGKCWVCNSGSWIPETDPTKCNDFWISDNCPPGPPVSPLICGDANPPPNPDNFPLTSPGYNNCWLCTNPMEPFLASTFNGDDNPLYTDFSIPCDIFWVDTPEDYPPYLDIPNNPDDVETVCNNPLSSLTLSEPGVVYDPATNQWGCWTCDSPTSNYEWTYWRGGRFNWLGNGPPDYTAQYKTCDEFWVQGNYTASAADPPAPLPCGDPLPTTDPGYKNCWLCTNPSENYFTKINGFDKDISPLYGNYGDPCSEYWHTPDYPAYIDIPNEPDNVETVCADPLPLTDGIKKPGLVYDSDAGHWGCWLCTSGGNYNWIYWRGDRFEDVLGIQYQACHNFWIKATYPAVIPPSDIPTSWMYEYGSAGRYSKDSGNSIATPGDGYIYVAGKADGYGYSLYRYSIKSYEYVMRIDETTGVVDWKKAYGSTTGAGSIVVPGDGYIYLHGGFSGSIAHNSNAITVIRKLDKTNGNVIWGKKYDFGVVYRKGHARPDNNSLMAVPGDGYIYLTGSYFSNQGYAEQESSAYVIRLDSDGNLGPAGTWAKKIDSSTDNKIYEHINSIAVEGNYIYLTGYNQSYLPPPRIYETEQRMTLFKLNKTTGTLSWARAFNDISTEFEEGKAISVPGDGFIYATGGRYSLDCGILIMRLDLNGNVGSGYSGTWNKCYGGSTNHVHIPTPESISVPGDGYIYITGSKDFADNIIALRVNKNNGDVDWKREYGGRSHEVGKSISVVNGYFAITGSELSDKNYHGHFYYQGKQIFKSTGGDIFVIVDNKESPLLGTDISAPGWDGGMEYTYNYQSISGLTISNLGLSKTDDYSKGTTITDDKKSGWFLEGIVLDDEILTWETSEPPPTGPWHYEFGGSGTDIGHSISVPGDGYIYVSGTTGSQSAGLNDIFLMKVKEADGTVEWKKHFGGAGREYGYAMTAPGDGDIYLAGAEYSTTSGDADIFVISISGHDGDLIWAKRYGSTGKDSASSIMLSEDGYLYVTGQTQNAGNSDVFVIRLNEANGNVKWKKRYGGSGYDKAEAISWTDGGENGFLYVTGYQQSETAGNYDIFVMKLRASNGNRLWRKHYGGLKSDFARAITAPGDGNVYITGEEYSTTSGASDIFVMRLNENSGDVKWKKRYGGPGPETGNAITLSLEGDLYVTGKYNSGAAGGSDVFVMKLDRKTGIADWKRSYGGENNDFARSISVSGDYFFVTGYEDTDVNPALAVPTGRDIFVIADETDPPTLGKELTGWTTGGTDLPNTEAWAGKDLPDSAWSAANLTGAGWDGIALTGGSWSGTAIADGTGWSLEGVTIFDEVINWSVPAGPGPPHYWQYEYGGDDYDLGRSIAAPGDGYIYITGRTLYPSKGAVDVFVMRVREADGVVDWKKRYGGDKIDEAFPIAVPGDGYVYVAGYQNSLGSGGYDMFVLRLDESNGAVDWSKTYGGNASEVLYSMAVPGDGYVYLTGYTYSSTFGGADMFVMRVNAGNGLCDGNNNTWRKQYGTSGYDYLRSITVPGDGFIYLIGDEQPTVYDRPDIIIMRISTKNGNISWKKIYANSTGWNRGFSIAANGDGYVYATGYQSTITTGGQDTYLFKIDAATGNSTWKKRYGSTLTDIIYSIAAPGDGYVYLTGYIQNLVKETINIFLVKINSKNGSIAWKKRYGGDNNEAGSSVAISGDYVYLTGYEETDTNVGLDTGRDMFIIAENKDAPAQGSDLTEWITNGVNLPDTPEWNGTDFSINVKNPVGAGWEGADLTGSLWAGVDIADDDTGWVLEGINLNDEFINWGATTAPTSPWRYEYGGDENDNGYSISLPGDGYIYVTGQQDSDSVANFDIYAMKLRETDGVVEWKRYYGGDKKDIGYAIAATPGGHVYIAGRENSETSSAGGVFILRVNSSKGRTDWRKNYGDNNSDYARSISAPGNEYVYVTGVSGSQASGPDDAFVMKVGEREGNVAWKKRYGGPDSDVGYSITKGWDSCLYITGKTDRGTGNKNDVFVMKLRDRDGKVMFKKYYGGSKADIGHSIVLAPSGHLYVTGKQNSKTSGDFDVFVMKLNRGSGNIIWKKHYGGTGEDIGKSIAAPGDGYVYVTGGEMSKSSGGDDVFMLRINESNGNAVKQVHYGGAGSDIGHSIAVRGNYFYITGSESTDINGPLLDTKDDILVLVDDKVNPSGTPLTGDWASGNLTGDWTSGNLTDSGWNGTNLTGAKWKGVNLPGGGAWGGKKITGWSLEGVTLDDEIITGF